MFKAVLRVVSSLALGFILASCGGGGGSGGPVADSLDPAIAAQISDQVSRLLPADEQERVAVFVELGSTQPASGATVEPDAAERRRLQEQFLAQLGALGSRPLNAATGEPACSSADLASRIGQALKPRAGSAVRVDMSACELRLLPQLKGVRGVHADIPLSFDSAADARAIGATVLQSFDGQSAWPALNQSRLDGSATVIAVLDTGVDERHPALGQAKVLPGACFSTPSNGGKSLCPGGASADTSSPTAGRSCIEQLGNTSAVRSGCSHGTAMAAAAVMDYSGVLAGSGGVARGASVLPVQVFALTSLGALSANSGDLLRAIEWVTDQAAARRSAGLAPIAAVNMSLGGGLYAAACDDDYVGGLFNKAFAELRAQGVVPVVSAGNAFNRSAISFPACVSNAVSVAAAKLGYSDIASYSNFSAQVKLFAIGGDSDGTYRLPALCPPGAGFDCWAAMSGTSPAAALASGAVAVLRAANPSASADSIEQSLTRNLAGLRADALSLLGKPALRLTPAASVMLGAAAVPVQPVAETPAPVVDSPVSSGARSLRVCVHEGVGFTGRRACTTVTLAELDPARVYSYWGWVNSVSIHDATTDMPVSGQVKVTLYGSNSYRDSGVGMSADTASVVGLRLLNLVRTVRIEAL